MFEVWHYVSHCIRCSLQFGKSRDGISFLYVMMSHIRNDGAQEKRQFAVVAHIVYYDQEQFRIL